jgi:hypothetical protein
MAGKGNAAAMGDGIAVLIRGTTPGTPACIRSGRQAGRRGWHGSRQGGEKGAARAVPGPAVARPGTGEGQPVTVTRLP